MCLNVIRYGYTDADIETTDHRDETERQVHKHQSLVHIKNTLKYSTPEKANEKAKKEKRRSQVV